MAMGEEREEMNGQGFHHAEELKRQQAIEEALLASTKRALTQDEALLVAGAAGILVKEKQG